ncbi:MAG: sigma-70 family RNA polymerase sigma factor [Acidobacteria bacterium]|nr:sigma-70 family RNA polymerase sigma factor [Acidobacteriota bacterium]
MNANLDSYVIEQATLRARLLAATAGFPPDDLDDLRQELLLDYLRRKPRFDETRGEPDGFARGVMRNQAAALVKKRCRRARHEILAGDLFEPDSENAADAVFRGVHQRDLTTHLDVSLDVQRVLRQLPVHLQRVAYLLAELPVSEVCLVIGKSRSRAYQMIRQLRVAFVRAGLNPNTLRRTPRPHRSPPSGGRV